MFCEQQGVWNRTLAGLVIPGPCRDGEFGESHRMCSYAGEWMDIDFSECYEQGCSSDAGWPSTPVRMTLRKSCADGYRGYQYRRCLQNGVWNAVDAHDCGRHW